MEVSEEEFQSLKVEQSILVDFHQFPDKFIELLEECVSSRGEANPRFLAVLRLGAEEGDDSALGVVETNKFKHLSHISLAFAPGDDASIKKYLAAAHGRQGRDVWRRSHGDASDELGARAAVEAAADATAQRGRAPRKAAQAPDELAAKLKRAPGGARNTKTRMEASGAPRRRVRRNTLTSRNNELDAARELMEQYAPTRNIPA